jgi:hypothetical protein
VRFLDRDFDDDRCVDEGLRRTIATIAAFAGKFQQRALRGGRRIG